jgi:1,4-alpha-glucan branching enzyme
VPHSGYVIGLPRPGRWREVLNTDSALYGGSNMGNEGGVVAGKTPSHGFACSAAIVVPPLATLWFVHDGE